MVLNDGYLFSQAAEDADYQLPLVKMKCAVFRAAAPIAVTLFAQAEGACLSSGNQDTINNLLTQGGPNTVVSLCPGTTIPITAPIVFTAAGQEISTEGYPTDDTRATVIIQ